MGLGVAKEVATRYPTVKKKYKAACNAGVFNLGYAQFVLDEENDQAVYNLATQKQAGPNGSRWGVFLAFANMFEHAAANNIVRIAIPRIGCGIAKLDWNEDVLPMIELARDGSKYPIHIAVYDL
jgi:O-acetyl-ADP-ribose deacetylase (regulator of RNase III)